MEYLIVIGKTLKQSIVTTHNPMRNQQIEPRVKRERGFTLIELLVVLAIVALLLTLSVPRYFQSIDRSKETILIENLRVTRDVIGKFYADRGRYPESLDELVEKKYLREIPFDPLTDNNNTWQIIPPEGDQKGAVYDLKSSAPGQTADGKKFSEL